VRIAAWVGAGALLLVPLIAMAFTDAVRWTASDFIFAGALGATALALVGTTGVTLALGQVPNPHVPTVELIGLTVFYGALFAGPAALLWTGARRGPA
jgi:hypothetical protein